MVEEEGMLQLIGRIELGLPRGTPAGQPVFQSAC
jgi:hypothetical protein